MEDLVNSIVSILDAHGRPAGTGFVVSTVTEDMIVTCAHVIGKLSSEVMIVFQITGEQREAKVIDQWWRSEETEDVAILQIDRGLPPGVQPLPLGSAKGTVGHQVSTFGFSNVGQVKGMGGDGIVVRQVTTTADRSLLQLRSSEITPGFSGAPVWDKLQHRVIGMVSEITLPDRYSRLAKTAFAVPTETLQAICPLLRVSEVRPYRSLEIFTEADTTLFFGRQHVINELVESLRAEPHFLALLGPSGSGKSSVVQAGLIPSLRRGAVPGSDRWEINITRPADPSFTSLLIAAQQTRLQSVLVIDQFEEFFVASSRGEQLDSITHLTELLEYSLHISIILILRDDFYSRFAQQETLVKWLKGRTVNIPPLLKRDELKDMIQEPARAVGLHFEEGLVEAIVKDALEVTTYPEERRRGGRSTVLPLLEFALTQLWVRREEGILSHMAYEQIGGITGGLAQWANRAFFAFEREQRLLARRIFTDLIYLGSEEQNIPDSRRQRLVTSLSRSEDEQEIISQVVRQLVSARLLVASRDKQNQEEKVEIIHEALLHEWSELRRWIADDRRFLIWHQELERRTQMWIDTNAVNVAQRDRDKLFRGRELVEAESWLSEHKTDLNAEEQGFIEASIAEKRRQEQMEREQKERELALRRRATHRQRLLISLIAVILLVVILAPLIARARFQILLASVTNLNSDGPGSLLQAIKTASPNSTITFADGLSGTITLSDNNPGIAIDKNLIISGPGPSVLSISGGNSYRVFEVTSEAAVTISGLAIKGGEIALGRTVRFEHGGSSIYNEGTLELKNSVITGNTFDFYAYGGTIFNDVGAALSISNSIISGNTVDTSDPSATPSVGNEDRMRGGGGLNNFGTAILTNSIISGNTVAYGSGGGIFNSGTLTIRGSTITHNAVSTKGDVGGGVFNSGTLIMHDSTISDNGVMNSKGGGIYNAGTLTVQTSTISDNRVTNGNGGGIYTENTLSLYDCTISGNIVTNGDGGGIEVAKATGKPDDSISYCTIYNNTATNGGGMVTSNQNDSSVGKVKMEYSILAGNHASRNQDIIGTLFVSGHNLIEDESNATIHITPGKDSAPPLTGVSPKLGPLRNNGGPTQTHAVLPGSPAIGLAPCSTPTGPELRTDQRGVPNYDLFGNGCAIGSYQPESG